MRTSRDAEELKQVWLGWRRESGRPIREQFKKYVEMSNRGAQKHGKKKNLIYSRNE